MFRLIHSERQVGSEDHRVHFVEWCVIRLDGERDFGSLRIVRRHGDGLLQVGFDLAEMQGKGQFAGFTGLQRVRLQLRNGAAAGWFGRLDFEDRIAGVLELEHAGDGGDLRGLAEVVNRLFKLDFRSTLRQGGDAHGAGPQCCCQ